MRIFLVAVALLTALGMSALMARSASAHAVVSTQTHTAMICKNSQGFTNWWGYGIHVSHCDLQGINSWGDTYSAVATALSYVYSPAIGVVASALWAYKSFLQSQDHGNGILSRLPLGRWWSVLLDCIKFCLR